MYSCILVSYTGKTTYKHFAESMELALHYCVLDLKEMTLSDKYTKSFKIYEIIPGYNKEPILKATIYVEADGQIRVVPTDAV
jgi:hypothetical protein